MTTLVLLRHGQSLWNQEKTFTGWTDIGLSERGEQEATAVGRRFAAEGVQFDLCFTSVLSRATETARLVLRTMGSPEVPLQPRWRLNERHYGALQGLSFWEAVRRFGLAHTLRCQRRYGVRPPMLTPDDPRFPGADPRYSDVPPSQLPLGESLDDTLHRLLPCWQEEIGPAIQRGQRVLIVSHRNLLRSLIKHMRQLPDSKAPNIKVPTATPLVYELDDQLRVVEHRTMSRDAVSDGSSHARPTGSA